MPVLRRLASLAFVLIVAGCGVDRSVAPIFPDDPNVVTTERIFFGTTRAPNGKGSFGFERSFELTLGTTEVSIPPQREVGSVSNGGEQSDPKVDFVLTKKSDYSSTSAFQRALRDDTNSAGPTREVTVFVHGFNTSFPEALYRAAQMKHDLEVPGSSIVYSWPSRAHALGYEYDDDSVDFARDGLESLLRTVRSSSSANIVLVAHSMGANLTMETLRQMERSDPGWTDKSLAGIILISPDIDIDVFKSQLASVRRVPDPFVIFSSQKDRALGLSAMLTGQPQRLGNISDVSVLADLPVSVVDVTAFSEGSGLNHFVPASSPTLIAMFNRSDRLDREFLRGDSDARPTVLNAERQIVRGATEIVLLPFER